MEQSSKKRRSNLASTLNRVAFVAGGITHDDPPASAGGPDHWIYDQWRLELRLVWGWLGITTLLATTILLFGVLGDLLGGYTGRQTGLDLGVGVVAFGFAGAVVHLIHSLSLGLYWMKATWGHSSIILAARPKADVRVPLPSDRVRRFLASSGADLPIQVALAMVTLLVMLWLNP